MYVTLEDVFQTILFPWPNSQMLHVYNIFNFLPMRVLCDIRSIKRDIYHKTYGQRDTLPGVKIIRIPALIKLTSIMMNFALAYSPLKEISLYSDESGYNQ